MTTGDTSGGYTLQINLCAGDAAYAELTVPALVRAHPDAAERLAVVDCCRPQRTRIFDPEQRLPAAVFAPRLAKIRAIAEGLRAAGCFDRVEYLEPGDVRFRTWASRYARPWMRETHDYGGCAFMAYWAALDLPRTRHVVHYDADMCVYQAPGFSWVAHTLAAWPEVPAAVMATPRISPPGFARHPGEDAPSRHEARPAERVPAGWLNDWFSTRCLLVDRKRLAPHLPLVGPVRALQYRLRRRLDRGYPPGPEALLHLVLGPRGYRRLNLADERAWLLHPTAKNPTYLELLPRILAAVAAGRVPEGQRGLSDFDLPQWQAWLGAGAPP